MVRKVALALLSTALALLAAEGLVRALGAAPDVGIIHKGRFRLSANPLIGYEPVPGFVYHGPERSFIDYAGASNALGYRDVDHAVAKPAGTYRIVVLGDSVAAGLGVDRFEDTFPAVLQDLLRARGLRAEVISLAVSGYNTQQEVETLRERGLRYSPDLVLVDYTLNDRQRMDGGIMETLLAEATHQPGGRAFEASPSLVKSALYRLVAYRALAPDRHPAGPAVASAGPAAEMAHSKALEEISGDTVDASLGRLQELSKAHGFAVLIAIFPYFPRAFEEYPREKQHRFARAEAAKYGFQALDLLEVMAHCRQRSPVPINVDNVHPNEVGHRCAAEAMADRILGGLAPAPTP